MCQKCLRSHDVANFCKLLLIKIFYIFFRFQYPERPTLFFAICYMIVSLICLIGLVMPEAIVCSTEKINLDQVVEHGTGLIQGATQRPCTIIFMLFFYFSSEAQSIFFLLNFEKYGASATIKIIFWLVWD